MSSKTQAAPPIALRNISKAYTQPNRKPISILENINLELRVGEIIALLGPSGSGKSTLMRIVAGSIPPTQGQVLYHNRPLVGINPGVAIAFQNFALYPWLTVIENVELGLKAKGISLEARRDKASQTIDLIGLGGFENAYPRELSGGMRQRVGFARALAVEPELLCMDEPFSALDVLTAENLRLELLDLWLEKRIPTQAILIVTHSIEEAVLLADRIIVLGRNPGRIRADFPVRLKHYRDRKSSSFGAIVDRVYKILTNPNLEPSEIQTTVATTKPTAIQKYQSLPSVRIGSIAGLLEILENRQNQDIYRLGQELQLEIDDLLPIVEAAKFLDFIEVVEGDIHLKPIAAQFIGGSIDERKEIASGQMLWNIRLVQQIYNLCRSTAEKRISEDLILDILQNHFSPKEARRQLDTAIDWGRYAELYGYDEPTGEIFLEETDAA